MNKPICDKCGLRPCKTKGKYPNGQPRYKAVCWKCDGWKLQGKNAKQRVMARLRKKHLTGICSECGFKCKNLCQMDLDHKDGNHNNNDPANLQELCACCHRLKTLDCEDWKPTMS